jgi:mRNA-degrading endonuclease RelE of RelBE toxin-antitoxin system
VSYKIFPTKQFEKELKRLVKKFPSLTNEFGHLIDKLEENPTFGVSISGNCYKIRLSISSKGKGKSGGARVITYVYFKETSVYLLTIYDKSELSNVKNTELLEMIKRLNLDEE